MPTDTLRVCSIPHASLNPYIAASNRELARRGVAFTAAARTPKEIGALLQPGLILHFHWPSLLYAGRDADEFARKSARFFEVMERARALGCRVVWTAHNVFPHENQFPDLDLRARRRFLQICDHILVHCAAGQRELAATFEPLPPVTIAPHLDYRHEYPAPPDRATARAALGVPADEFVFLMFGMLRPYKNFALAIDAWRAARLPKARLLIAGAPLAGDDAGWLRHMVGPQDGIELRVAHVPHGEVPALFAAADAALFTYERILASGGVALTQAMGRAVIAPRVGCLPDMVPEDCGLLFAPGSATELATALHGIISRDVDAMGRRGQAHIARWSPEVFAAKVLEVYRGLPGR